MLDILPAVLWCIAMVMSLFVIGVCVARGRLLRGYSGGVPIVSWNLIYVHIASALLGTVPYMAYVWYSDTGAFDPDVRDFYAAWGWPSAVIFIVALVIQWVCMYAQARRAARSQLDARLGSAHSAHSAPSDRADASGTA
ncbi:hypothetical protein CSQ85_01845 [Bifidobacterium rousetti]|uniref:hypothetical protein n=1 Tax=Bifidobacterium rousetti TaxID=2045439 RepID=UPI001238565E|nr:hypothetical protein [Bifidobacterium rousetti]KAA8820547.1 hypothetical protein CSQ85_01845 [Bifidobacterium rousetti]